MNANLEVAPSQDGIDDAILTTFRSQTDVRLVLWIDPNPEEMIHMQHNLEQELPGLFFLNKSSADQLAQFMSLNRDLLDATYDIR